MVMSLETFVLTEAFSNEAFNRFSTCLEELRAEDNVGERINIYSRTTANDLTALLATAFWASLTPEEGAYHDLRISFGPPQEFASNYVFVQPQDYLPAHVSDLAPALTNTTRSMGVWYSENGKMQIWGFADAPYWDITVTATRPGQLIFSMLAGENGFKLAFSGSRWGIVDHSRTPLYRAYVGGAVPSLDGLEGIKMFGLSMMRESSYESLIRGMLEHKHGGTLVIVPEDDHGWRSSCSLRYESVSPFKELRDNSERWEDERQKYDIAWLMPSDFRRQRVADSSKMVAQLTAVDGATILGRDLEVYGFGAKLLPLNPNSRPQKIVQSTPFQDEPYVPMKLSDLGGTRHQSAAQFVYDHPDCFAIVCSQDGRVSSMHWDEIQEAVVIITHLEYAL